MINFPTSPAVNDIVTATNNMQWKWNGTTWLMIGPLFRRSIKADTTTTYYPVLTDENQMITLSNAAAIQVVLPSDATTAFAIGSEVDFLWYGVGQPSFVAGAGASAYSTPGLKLRARFSLATIKKTASNTWVIIGDLAP